MTAWGNRGWEPEPPPEPAVYEPDVEVDIEVDRMGARVSLFSVSDYDLPELLTPAQARDVAARLLKAADEAEQKNGNGT